MPPYASYDGGQVVISHQLVPRPANCQSKSNEQECRNQHQTRCDRNQRSMVVFGDLRAPFGGCRGRTVRHADLSSSKMVLMPAQPTTQALTPKKFEKIVEWRQNF